MNTILDILSKLPPDYWGPRALYPLKPWLNVGDDLSNTQFVSHFFSHAVFAFFFLSFNTDWGLLCAIIFGPVYAVFKEIFFDKHFKESFSNKDARTDLLSRVGGGLFPFITLIWG